jgi:MFS transporter, OPA family, sugar phosphate sensor protein UhpC
MFKKYLSIFRSKTSDYQHSNPAQIEKKYSYWRIRTLYSIYIGYVLFYFTRKSLTFALPLLSKKLHLSMAELGILSTVLYLTYGVSKFFSGIVSDYVNPRYFMSAGLILTGVINIFFGFSSSLFLFAIIWGLNGIFQGWGWPPCTKQLTYWFSKKERGTWWSIHSTSHNVGGAIIPLFVAMVIAYSGDWRWAMWAPGILAILGGLFLFERMRDIPESMGLPPIEVYKNEKDTVDKPSQEKSIITSVLKNKYVWVLALSYFFVYIVRTALNDWGALYFVKYKHYSMVAAATSITWFEVGGFFGILVAGWFSDKLLGGRRIPYILYCCLLLALVSLGLWFVPKNNLVLDFVLMGVLGFLVFGPQLLVGLAAAEFVDKSLACTANGFAGWFSYIGAACAGYPLGLIIDHWGWDGFFVVLIFCSLAAYVVILPIVLKTPEVVKSPKDLVSVAK